MKQSVITFDDRAGGVEVWRWKVLLFEQVVIVKKGMLENGRFSGTVMNTFGPRQGNIAGVSVG